MDKHMMCTQVHAHRHDLSCVAHADSDTWRKSGTSRCFSIKSLLPERNRELLESLGLSQEGQSSSSTDPLQADPQQHKMRKRWTVMRLELLHVNNDNHLIIRIIIQETMV